MDGILPLERWDWLASRFWGNPVRDWLWVLGLAAGGYVGLWLLRTTLGSYCKKLARRTATDIDDFLADLLASLHPLTMLSIAVWFAAEGLRLPTGIQQVIHALPWLAPLLQLAFWAGRFADFLFARYLASRASEPERLTAQTMLGPLRFMALIAFWGLLLALALQNMGMNVTALVTGLGIGGVAVALAVQNILRDAFAAFSIVMDKPFIVGDFIQVDAYQGTVEYIGMKTTRLRALGGEELIFPNSDLLKGRIRNFRRMRERRVVFQLTLSPLASCEALAQVAPLAREAVVQHAGLRFERAHLMAFTPFGVTLEVVYFAEDPDYTRSLDTLQAIQLDLVQRLTTLGVPLAQGVAPSPSGLA